MEYIDQQWLIIIINLLFFDLLRVIIYKLLISKLWINGNIINLILIIFKNGGH